jgi:hypothetical protein
MKNLHLQQHDRRERGPLEGRLALALCASSLVFAAMPSVADARPRPARRGSDFEANKGFGLGLMIGVPNGLSGKLYLGTNTALDFGIGSYYRGRYDRSLNAHMDFLWHPFVLAKAEPFWVPLYFGIGGRLLDHGRDNRNFSDDTHLGVRVPLGIALDFNNVPLDIFFELAFVFDIITDAGHNYSDFNSALGIRYYFN